MQTYSFILPANTASWRTKGKMGNKSVDMMLPTAFEDSLIISMAMAIRLLKKITVIKMIKRQTPQTMESPNQVLRFCLIDEMSVVSSSFLSCKVVSLTYLSTQ